MAGHSCTCKVEVKDISHKKLISKSDHFMGMIMVSKIMLKSQNSRLVFGSLVRTPGTAWRKLLNPGEIERVLCNNIRPQMAGHSCTWTSQN